MSSVRDDVQRRGQHDDAGEDRDEEPHPLDEERERELRRGGERERRGVHADEHRDVPDERGDDEQPEQADELHARFESLEQAAPRRDVLGEHRLAQQSAPPAIVRSTKPALRRLPMQPTRAQTDLACNSHAGVASSAHARAVPGVRVALGRTRRITPMATKSNVAITAMPTNADTRYPIVGCLSWLKSYPLNSALCQNPA